MDLLRSCQAAFCQAVRSGAADALLPMLMEPEELAARRIQAYRSNFIGTLSAALESAYPVVARIVGMPFFLEAARQFILATPSESGDLNEYGEGFGDFLAAYPHAANLGYLADVARMEWLAQQVFYAPEPAAADLSILARIDEARYGDLRFSISPALARIDSSWPLADIWRVNQPNFDGELAVDFSCGAQVLILRRGGMAYVEAISAGDAALFDGLASGKRLSEAAAKALQVSADIDLTATLARFIRDGTLRHARLAEDAAD